MSARDNDTRRRDPRQGLADELAEELAGPGLRVARMLEMLSVPGDPEPVAQPDLREMPAPGTRPVEDPVSSPPPPIGIWAPRRGDAGWTYVRPPIHPLGDHHAARREFALEPLPGRRRIVFLGESVAAGYLLAPHWTPARALESRLSQLAGGADFEVVDLARTNEKLSTLLSTWEASRVLAPEAWVIFAGNNWNLLDDAPTTRFPTTARERQELAMALAAEGWEGPARRARRALRQRVDAAFDRIAKGAREPGAQVVWVLPEVELASWEVAQPVAWTPSAGGARRWHALRSTVLDRLAAGDARGALEAAEAMTAIDGAHQPTSHRLRARAYQALGQHDAAHQAAMEAVDGAQLARLGALASPQIDSEIQGWVRAAAARPEFSVVDLPWLLATEDGLPGHELLLDYCHLSAEGIDRAMTATAEAVLEIVEGSSPQPSAALAPLPVPQRALALAAVGAAVHGAHRHLPVHGGAFDAESWLRRALAHDAGILDTLVDLAEARSGPVPAVLGQGQQRQLDEEHRLLLQHGWRWDHIDADLLVALLSVLDEHAPEHSARIRRRLVQHHGIETGARELSRAPYLWQPLARLLPEVMPEAEASRRATLRCPWPTTDLALVAEDTAGVVDVVLRLPPIEGWSTPREGEVRVLLEGVEIGRLPVEETWSRALLRLPESAEPGPLHRLTLCWPPLPEADEVALAHALERLEEGRETDLYPIFGEIARVRAHQP